MEIKRNIFESSARMPARYELVGPPTEQADTPNRPMVGLQMNDRDVRHAPIPRIGEQR
ncbi:MAG: hypothetical protein WC829_01215 [Hyphomicrobium sp.]|jgi:hypothetical protein